MRIRSYRDGDSDSCKALEAKASQHQRIPLLSDLFKAHIKHLADFDSKSKLFDDDDGSQHEIVVAEMHGRVVGVVCVGVKPIFLRGVETLAGYLFDLRVDEAYQRNRIGSKLSAEVERRCVARGVKVMYLTVNGSNAKALQLYDKLGWKLGSRRRLLFEPLPFVKPPASSKHQLVQRIPLDVFLAFVETNIRQADLRPVNLRLMLERSSFICAWKVSSVGSTEESAAVVSLCNGSLLSAIHIEQFILPYSWWITPFGRFLRIAIPMAAVALFLRFAVSLCSQLPWWAQIGAAAVSAFVGTWAWGLASFVYNIKYLRARLVAPCAAGPEGVELLRVAVQHARSEARKLGFAVCVSNFDGRHPLIPAFTKKAATRFPTRFLYRVLDAGWLQGPLGGNDGSEPFFDPANFFDPRDLL